MKAMVPLAEMFGYVTALRTITSGRATSSMVYSHHALSLIHIYGNQWILSIRVDVVQIYEIQYR